MATILVVVLSATVASTLGQNCSASKPQTIIQTNHSGGFSEHKTWPWMALLGYKHNQSVTWCCEGMLINKHWVLSHAFNIFDISHAFDRLVVRLSEYDYADDLDGAVHQDFSVVDISYHPEYSHVNGRHSLVLIKLNSTVPFEKFINPVCLPWGVDSNKNITDKKGLVVAYWSITGSFSTVQKEREVVVLPDPVCDRQYEQTFGQETFCASNLNGEINSCWEDFGAPLVTVEASERYVAVGILSYSHYCDVKEFPNLYNNLRYPAHLAWIKSVAFTTL
ncbi:venom protease-like isoform X2 [Scylla paramamosain]|uniref:venom protease-like isoform X2 n=1 Tax=Scylla paramamosain TaxID=85552 RepID=UPI003083192E